MLFLCLLCHPCYKNITLLETSSPVHTLFVLFVCQLLFHFNSLRVLLVNKPKQQRA